MNIMKIKALRYFYRQFIVIPSVDAIHMTFENISTENKIHDRCLSLWCCHFLTEKWFSTCTKPRRNKNRILFKFHGYNPRWII